MSRNKVTLTVNKQAHVGFVTDVLPSLAGKIIREIRPELLVAGALTLSLVFVDDSRIKALNKQYLGKNQPTDVLSFPFLEGQAYPDNGQLGEILISVPTLTRQAKAHKHRPSLEAKILFVHGLLHILGFDHEKKKDLPIMLALEQKYLGDNAGLIERSHPE